MSIWNLFKSFQGQQVMQIHCISVSAEFLGWQVTRTSRPRSWNPALCRCPMGCRCWRFYVAVPCGPSWSTSRGLLCTSGGWLQALSNPSDGWKGVFLWNFNYKIQAFNPLIYQCYLLFSKVLITNFGIVS